MSGRHSAAMATAVAPATQTTSTGVGTSPPAQSRKNRGGRRTHPTPLDDPSAAGSAERGYDDIRLPTNLTKSASVRQPLRHAGNTRGVVVDPPGNGGGPQRSLESPPHAVLRDYAPDHLFAPIPVRAGQPVPPLNERQLPPSAGYFHRQDSFPMRSSYSSGSRRDYVNTTGFYPASSTTSGIPGGYQDVSQITAVQVNGIA